jgi:hypothetical protein
MIGGNMGLIEILLLVIAIIVLIILYKLFSFQIATYFLEQKISKMRPIVIRFLNHEKSDWEEILKKFNENDKVVRINFNDTKDIMENIEKIERDIDIVNNKYQILKIKYGKNSQSQMGIVYSFVKYLECLLYLGKTSHLVHHLTGKSEDDHREMRKKRDQMRIIIEEAIDLDIRLFWSSPTFNN